MEQLNEAIERQKQMIAILKDLKELADSENEKFILDVKIGCYHGLLRDLEILKRDIEEES